MELVRKFWKFLVAIKDGLVLILLLLFFGGLTLLLSSSPEGAQVTDGALILALDGTISEQPADIDPLSTLLSGAAPMREYSARDIIHALDKAKSDDRVTMVVLDLDRFIGGGQATLAEVGERLDAVKKSGKPIHAFATIYTNDSYQLASHASQIWVNPQGGVLLAPPGGKGLYFAQALKKFGVTANVYRTGTYKAAVEPYLRDDQSPEAEENEHSLYASIWESWNDEVKAARPSAQIDALIKTPAELVEAAKGNLANMALGQKLVDHIATPVAFAAAMNAALKEEPGDYPLDIAGTHIDDYIMALPIEQSGRRLRSSPSRALLLTASAGLALPRAIPCPT